MIRTVVICLSILFSALTHAQSITCTAGSAISVSCGSVVVPPVPQCPSPPGSGPCGTPAPQCPSPPGSGPCVSCPDGQHVPPWTCPITPPPTGISCPGFSKTVVLTANWATPIRLYAPFGPSDAVVVVFTTGSVSTPNNNLGHIGGAEWGTNPSTRLAALSPKPCDWSNQNWPQHLPGIPADYPGASSSGNSVNVPFAVGSGANFGFYPILELNTTYYFNIKNDASAGCAVQGSCDMFLDLAHPPGM